MSQQILFSHVLLTLMFAMLYFYYTSKWFHEQLGTIDMHASQKALMFIEMSFSVLGTIKRLDRP